MKNHCLWKAAEKHFLFALNQFSFVKSDEICAWSRTVFGLIISYFEPYKFWSSSGFFRSRFLSNIFIHIEIYIELSASFSLGILIFSSGIKSNILCPLIISTFSWGQKSCAYYGKSAYLGKMCLFWEVEDFAF